MNNDAFDADTVRNVVEIALRQRTNSTRLFHGRTRGSRARVRLFVPDRVPGIWHRGRLPSIYVQRFAADVVPPSAVKDSDFDTYLAYRLSTGSSPPSPRGGRGGGGGPGCGCLALGIASAVLVASAVSALLTFHG